jgi:N utilization substance protein A
VDFDARMLTQLATDQHVPLEEVATVVTKALTDAYARTSQAQPHAAAALDLASGRLCVTTPDGTDVTPKDFGRLAAATARQALVQWLRDVDRRRKVGWWADTEGTAVTATVRAPGRDGEVRLEAGGVDAVLPAGEAVPGEVLHRGQQVSVYVLAANMTDRDTVRLTVSRRQPALVTALFAQVVPELSDGSITVTAVAREPGERTKIAVAAAVAGLDARQLMIGGRSGHCLRHVVEALAGEEVDVVVYDADAVRFASAALAPETVLDIRPTDEYGRQLAATVSDIGCLPAAASVTNARLAGKLCGVKITLLRP